MAAGKVIRTADENDVDNRLPFEDGSSEKIYDFPSIPQVGLEIGIPKENEPDTFTLYTVHHVSWYPTEMMEIFIW